MVINKSLLDKSGTKKVGLTGPLGTKIPIMFQTVLETQLIEWKENNIGKELFNKVKCYQTNQYNQKTNICCGLKFIKPVSFLFSFGQYSLS